MYDARVSSQPLHSRPEEHKVMRKEKKDKLGRKGKLGRGRECIPFTGDRSINNLLNYFPMRYGACITYPKDTYTAAPQRHPTTALSQEKAIPPRGAGLEHKNTQQLKVHAAAVTSQHSQFGEQQKRWQHQLVSSGD